MISPPLTGTTGRRNTGPTDHRRDLADDPADLAERMVLTVLTDPAVLTDLTDLTDPAVLMDLTDPAEKYRRHGRHIAAVAAHWR
ncbi:hypothetical protein [Streptomyces noursei]|uniref:hypothetical protein n=1 Tax=Streptomyces noursei TaxID=1971 RepID=UPI001672838D|nr:hypothetical protein [Streptomyces noursei]MCZ1016363.1 hypothetical protein [Streptomyces noursei]GGX00238.1 hypothetical protein GCM10010341_22420 [Streptomyces noursei]